MDKKARRIYFVALIVLAYLFIVFATYECATVTVAHSTFENYYKFRGCVYLINRTQTYGYCSLSSGKIIKIVEYQGKWYLDGDLPGWPF